MKRLSDDCESECIHCWMRRKHRQVKTQVYGCYNANTHLNDFGSIRERINFHVAEEQHKGNTKTTEPTPL